MTEYNIITPILIVMFYSVSFGKWFLICWLSFAANYKTVHRVKG